jgi:magnesium chelatase subunit D
MVTKTEPTQAPLKQEKPEGGLQRIPFPFAAIVGQDKMKLALILNAINPQIGGVLIRGERGTCKTVAVRGLSEILPLIKVVSDCRFHCSPDQPSEMCPTCQEKYFAGGSKPLNSVTRKMKVADLPLGSTEDRVLGTIDLENAIKKGERTLDPGILADANRGICYIDEINLLDDNVIDALLDASSSKVNVVEREGISFSHPSSFILVGTMDPGEGELRPQLLDRIALHVIVKTISNLDQKVQIITERNEFDKDPVAFTKKLEKESNELKDRIIKARELMGKVELPDALLTLISRICKEVRAEGQRPDIMLSKTSKTLAAYDGRTVVNEDDIKKAVEFILPFRVRAKPVIEETYDDFDDLDDIVDQVQDEEEKDEEEEKTEEIPTHVFRIGSPIKLPRDLVKRRADRIIRSGSGDRIKSMSTGRKGRYIKHRIPDEIPQDIAFDATIRAAAPYQKYRKEALGDAGKGLSLFIKNPDLRKKVRENKVSTLIVLCVDASGSMGVLRRMEACKGVVLSMLMDAYQRRDKVAVVAFRGKEAAVVLPPTSSVERARKMLDLLPTGGRTPLGAGMLMAYNLVNAERKRDPTIIPIFVLLTDGRANVPITAGAEPMDEVTEMSKLIRDDNMYPIVIDTEVPPQGSAFIDFVYEYAQDIAKDLNGVYYKLADLDAVSLGSLIQMEKSALVEKAG